MPEVPKKYIGYFYGLDDCEHRYYVELNPHPDNPNVGVREITLAANPCVVTYDSQDGPFNPVMKSRMAVSVISGDWLFDLYSQDAHSCHAKLWKEQDGDGDELLWAGYVTNNLLNMPQDGCVNTFTVNCDDCLATLEDYDYRVLAELDGDGDYRQVVSFASLLRNIADICGHITRIVVDNTISFGHDPVKVKPADLKISERNFFSSDIDEEPWKFSEVLEEMCRWLGMTAIQSGDTLYLFDRQAHTTVQPAADADVTSYYSANISVYPFSIWSSSQYIVRNIAYREENVGGSGSDISLDSIYNTVTVKDSFFEIEDFVPDLFEDDYLTNYDGDEWTSSEVPVGSPSSPTYLNKKNNQKHDADDSANAYYIKQWHHKHYTPLAYVPPSNWLLLSPFLEVEFVEESHTGTSSAMTSYTATFRIRNRLDSAVNHLVMITEHYGDSLNETWYYENTVSQSIDLNPFSSALVTLTMTGFHQPTFDFSPQFCADNGVYAPVKYVDRLYSRATTSLVTAEIADLATVAKAKDESFYDRQIADTIQWDRYIMISQQDTPSTLANPRQLTQSQAAQMYPPLMRLNAGYHNPMILDQNAFLAINGSARIERYSRREYINESWTGDSTGLGGDYNASYWGLITGTHEIYTFPLALWFKLKVGDYWWDGEQWTDEESMFYVDVSTNVDEDGFIDFSTLWNNDFSIVNNVSYEEYSGASGYKIPLTGVQFDFSKQIEFYIHLPSRVQQYVGDKYHNGMNSYVYIKDFSLELYTKGAEKMDLSDVMYENVIDEGSNNRLSEITCRFTTYPDEGQHSYSTVGYLNGLANRFSREGLGTGTQKEEEAIVKMHVNQYSTPTVMQTVVMDMSPSILSRIKDTDMGKFFHITGMEIDYADAKKTISLVESKEYVETQPIIDVTP